MILRDYQKTTVSKVEEHIANSNSPALVALPTGAGKSLIIASLAQRAVDRGQKVLVVAHVKELVQQNSEKYVSVSKQNNFSIYSAGLDSKDFSGDVVFGSIQSLANSKSLPSFDLVLIDECHRISTVDSIFKNSQYGTLISSLKLLNISTKFIGLTATPYRTGEGSLYKTNKMDGSTKENKSDNFFFLSNLYEISIIYLISKKYLTEPVFNKIEGYDFSNVSLRNGRFNEQELDNAVKDFAITHDICQHIINITELKKSEGVMIFATNRQHASVILEQFPAGSAYIIDGQTPDKERDDIILKFKNREFKFIINISVLTTGFDAEHVDLIAILRPTESLLLYQQIVGRGLRLSEGKTNCLVLDFTDNPWSDLFFDPEANFTRSDERERTIVDVPCPKCCGINRFVGLSADLHSGRRCQHLDSEGNRCDFFFVFETCTFCFAQNDITARNCRVCGEILIHPDKKLKNEIDDPNKLFRIKSILAEQATTKSTNKPYIKITVLLENDKVYIYRLMVSSSKAFWFSYYNLAKPCGWGTEYVACCSDEENINESTVDLELMHQLLLYEDNEPWSVKLKTDATTGKKQISKMVRIWQL